MKSGKYRRSKLIPILWDIPHQVLYCQCGSSAQEKLVEIFSRTFNLDLQPGSAGVLARSLLEPQGKLRDYEDLKPTRFVPGPGGESQFPDYPWIAKSPEPNDFLGNEFLLWLWYRSTGLVHDGQIMFTKSINLDCAYGESGRDSLRGVDPSKMPEAAKALQSGKLPRKAGIILDYQGTQYQFTLQADRWEISGLQLPDIEDADSPRTLFEERITQLRGFTSSLDSIYTLFLQERISPHWTTRTSQISDLIRDPYHTAKLGG